MGIFIEDLTKSKKKLTHYLNRLPDNSKVLLIFDHGLGDFIMFLHLFNELLKRYPNIHLNIGCSESLGVKCLHKNICYLETELYEFKDIFKKSAEEKYDISSLLNNYDMVVNIVFPDAKYKALECNKLEIGLKPPFSFKKYKIAPRNTEPSNFIGLHFITNTSVNKKSLKMEQCKDVCDGIVRSGYIPYLIYTTFKSSNEYSTNFDFSWLEYRIDEKASVSDIIDKIKDMKYFIGVTSGPLCIAQNILGDDRCLNLDPWGKPISYFLNYSNMNSTNDFSADNICKEIKRLEKNNP